MKYLLFVLALLLASCSKDIPMEPVLGDWYATDGARWIFVDEGTVCRQDSANQYYCGIFWYRDQNDLYLIEGDRRYEIRYDTYTSIVLTDDTGSNPESFKLYRK